MKGIDVSRHNGEIDWGKVKADGISFAILRAGYGRVASQKDERFEQNYKGAKAAGLAVGAYWYSYATSPEHAREEARACLKVLNGRALEFPLYYDLEERRQFDKGRDVCDSLVRAFCGEMEAADYFAGLYCSTYWLTHFVSKEVSDRYALWVAQYGARCTYSVSPYGMWQYSGTGKVAGIEGNVDLDSCAVDYPAIIRAKGLSGYGEKPEKTIQDLAREVIAGKWGNGAERKQKLTAAGYDYAAVQKAVNEMLGGKSVQDLAREVLAGKWGNGDARKQKLTAAGYDYAAVQKAVNAMLGEKSVEDLAREVIAGKWGNGETRKQKLTAAGYDYAAVQKAVNEMLGEKSVQDLAREVIAGKWGNGETRKQKLTAAGYDYAAVQRAVNEMLK